MSRGVEEHRWCLALFCCVVRFYLDSTTDGSPLTAGGNISGSKSAVSYASPSFDTQTVQIQDSFRILDCECVASGPRGSGS